MEWQEKKVVSLKREGKEQSSRKKKENPANRKGEGENLFHSKVGYRRGNRTPSERGVAVLPVESNHL